MKKFALTLFFAIPMLLACSSAQAAVTISSLPYTISSPGNYVLGGGLTMSSSGVAINITASNVTLDMSGYGLTGPNNGGTGNYGISIHGQGVEIKNGYVTRFYYGILDYSGANDNRYTNLRVYSNTSCGFCLSGYGDIVRNCQSMDNGFGIYLVGIGSIVDSNAVRGNTHNGITNYGSGASITGNTVCNNGDIGIMGNSGDLIRGNTVKTNNMAGIYTSVCSHVNDNSCTDNGYAGNIYFWGSGCETTGYPTNTQ